VIVRSMERRSHPILHAPGLAGRADAYAGRSNRELVVKVRRLDVSCDAADRVG
jgi:hypothetical protein